MKQKWLWILILIGMTLLIILMKKGGFLSGLCLGIFIGSFAGIILMSLLQINYNEQKEEK